MRLGFLILLISLSSLAKAGTIIKCKNKYGDISYADEVCPKGSTQLSKTVLKPYKTSKTISQKNIKKAGVFPEHSSTPHQKALLQSRLTQVLTSLTAIKLKLDAYHSTEGSWPESFRSLNLDPKTLTSSLIHKTQLARNGKINVSLKSVFGSQKQIWIYPVSVMGNTLIEWHCYTNFPNSMLKMNKQNICESRNL